MESSEAKIFAGEDLASDSRTLLVNGTISSPTKQVTFDGGTVKENALAGRMILIGDTLCEVVSNTATKITLKENISSAADNAVIYPGEGGKGGRSVYSTLILGDNAYGVTELTGGGLQHIVKQLGSSGTADPLNQRATAGWKATKTAERLVEQYMIRIESASTFESAAN